MTTRNVLLNDGINSGYYVSGMRAEALGFKYDWVNGERPVTHAVISTNEFGRPSFQGFCNLNDAQTAATKARALIFAPVEIAVVATTACEKWIPAL